MVVTRTSKTWNPQSAVTAYNLLRINLKDQDSERSIVRDAQRWERREIKVRWEESEKRREVTVWKEFEKANRGKKSKVRILTVKKSHTIRKREMAKHSS